MTKVNITNILEEIFRVSEIKTPEELQMLIEAMEEMGDVEAFDTKNLADLAKRMDVKREA